MAFDSPAPISRRTVAKGIAWTAPAVAIAGTAPAFAVSGPEPTLNFVAGCKYPGNSCKTPALFQSYTFVFTVTNLDQAKSVFFCNAFLTNIEGDDGVAANPPTYSGGCIEVAAGGSGQIAFAFQGDSSANTSFTATLGVDWGHTCAECTAGTEHSTIYKAIEVLETPPQTCDCDNGYMPI